MFDKRQCALLLRYLLFLGPLVHGDGGHESIHVHGDGSSGRELSEHVKDRYMSLPYPRQDDIKAMWYQILVGPGTMQDIFNVVFHGDFNFCEHGMRILIAGCGTGVNMVQYAAGLLAASRACWVEPRWEVVCYDLSLASLGIARDKARIAGFIDNVVFVEGDILDISSSREALGVFDFIVSTGVLHHISDTMAAFRALQSVLRLGGGMDIMLYSVHGRSRKDLFRIQELVRIMNDAKGGNNEESRLLGAASVLASLPKEHPHANAYGDSQIWEGVADLYLHPHEKSFDPKGIFRIVRNLTIDGFAPLTSANVEECPAHLSGLSMSDAHMQLKWRNPEIYNLQKVAPGMAQSGLLTPEQEAQAAMLASPIPVDSHTFFLITPPQWRPMRYQPAPNGQRQPPVPGVVSNSNEGPAWVGTGRRVSETKPFGTPKSIDYNLVGRKIVNAYKKIGIPDMAKKVRLVAATMHREKGVTDSTSSGNEHKLLLTGTVDIGGSVTKPLNVYFGQTARKAAELFILEHKLLKEVQPQVEQMVSGWIARELQR